MAGCLNGRARTAGLFVIVHRVLPSHLIIFCIDRRGDFLTRVVELHRHRIDAVTRVLVGQVVVAIGHSAAPFGSPVGAACSFDATR